MTTRMRCVVPLFDRHATRRIVAVRDDRSVAIAQALDWPGVLLEAGRTDVAVVGFGDVPLAAALSPAITVLDQDPAGLGRIAVERLLRRIEDPGAPVRRRTVLPVRLIPRGSGELPPRA